MRLRRSLTGLAAIPVAAAALFIGSTSASASTVRPDSGGVCNPGCSANATFQSNGEIFTVHDYSPDSYSTIGYLWTWDGQAWKLHGSVWNRNGYKGAAVSKNFSIAEKTPVSYQVCLVNSKHKPFKCSKFYYDKA